MPRVLVPLAQGFEELEAVTVIEMLRRAAIDVVVAGVEPGPVRASRDVVVIPDTPLDAVLDAPFDMIVLPGGREGARRLGEDIRVRDLLRRMAAEGRFVAAICAAPGVLAKAGLLEGRHATAFPGILDRVPGFSPSAEADQVC